LDTGSLQLARVLERIVALCDQHGYLPEIPPSDLLIIVSNIGEAHIVRIASERFSRYAPSSGEHSHNQL
jgi:hypothetical protein